MIYLNDFLLQMPSMAHTERHFVTRHNYSIAEMEIDPLDQVRQYFPVYIEPQPITLFIEA